MKSLKTMILGILLVIAQGLLAIPVKPGLTKTLPLTDGTQVTAVLVGDEHGHYWLGQDGKAYQAIPGLGVYQTVDAAQIQQKAALRRSAANQRRMARMPRKVGSVGSISGDKKGIIILVNFTDKSFTASQSDFYNLANTVNYNSGKYKGSMYDYFYAQSEGQFRLTFDVVGPYTLSHNCAYYGGNDSSGDDLRPGNMVKEAVQLANADVNFANYDWDNDGYVDQVYVVYAGKGEADGGDDDTIWPHEWELSSATGSDITLDGKKINTYACGGEQNGGTGATAGIGTMCHEFSHCLGYPDFYDTDYSGGQGMFEWDLMDSGSYNDDGYRPAGYTSYERWVAGWKEPVELKTTQNIADMAPLQNTGSNTYIIYNNGNSDEYFLLENRQKVGWDAALPGAGLLILHVDYSSSAWENNQPNDDPSHQRMTWIPADNQYQYTIYQETKYYTEAGAKNDPFPYGNVNAFNKNTTPAAKFYNKNSDNTYYLDSSVENITQNSDKTISFSFVGAGDVVDPTPSGEALLYEGLSSYSGSDGSAALATNSDYLDYNNWSSFTKIYPGGNGYKNDGCLKFGNSSAVGSMTSGNISMTGSGTLTFYLKKYGSDSGKLNVTVTGATADVTEFTPSSEWGLCTVNLTNATGNVTITLATSTKRAYVDEITLTANSTPATTTPELITDPEILTFEVEAVAGISQDKTFDVLGADLTENVTVSLDDENNVFSISPTSISKADAENGATVSVTFTPTYAGTFTGTVTLSSAGAEPAVVALTGTATEGSTPVDPTPGSQNKPYTVAEARAAIDSGAGITGVYATGVVSKIVTAYNSTYGNISYDISSDGLTTSDQLRVYRGKSYNGDKFTSTNDIQVGDVVVVYGNLTLYNNSIYEFAENNQLVSLVRKSDVTMSFSPSSVEITLGETFTKPTLTTDPAGLTVIYESSNTDVATVDGSGDVTIVGIGTTTITASFAGNDDYNSGSASYTITVDEAMTLPSMPDDVAISSVSSTSITASWEATTNATSYDIDVVQGSSFEASAGGTVLETDFSSTTDWTLSGTGTYTGAGYYGASSPSIKFDGNGDYAISPAFTGGTKLQFWALGNNGSGSTFAISGLVGNSWTNIETVTIANGGDTYEVNLPSGTSQVRFDFTKSVNCALDDVVVYGAGGAPVSLSGYPKSVGNVTSYVITGLMPETQYAVRLRAVNSAGSSEWSETVTSTTSSQSTNPVATYYQPADGKKGSALKTSMCGIVYNRTEQEYDYLWTAYQTTDVRSDGKIWDMYSNITNYDPVNGSHTNSAEGSGFNREHSFPKSWFGGEVMPMFTDLHHLYPVDGNINTRRSNNPYGETNGEDYKSANDFSKLGACTYPGYTGKVFEPADEYKGDLARTYFYMVTCYEEKLHDWYTNNGSTEVTAVLDGNTYPGFQAWQLEMLMKWAKNDPVSEKETNRNNAVYGIQGNRNPFIDYPGLEEYIWGFMKDVSFSYDNYQQPVYNQDVTMSFGQTNVTATVGQDFVEPTLTTNPTNLTVTYSSSNEAVATVDASTGEVTPVAAGTTTIAATFAGNGSYNENSASYTLNVNGVNSVSLSETSKTIVYTDGAFTLTATVPSVNYNGTVMAESSNEYVAAVAVDGTTVTVTPVAVGTATITVTAGTDTYYPEAAQAECAVTVTMPAGSTTAPAPSADYTKITNAGDLTDGEYLIVYEGDNAHGAVAFNGGLSTLDAIDNFVVVTISSNTIASSVDIDGAVFTISSVQGGYSIKSASNNYIGYASDANGLTSSENISTNTISFNSDGDADIVGSGGAYLRYNYAINQNRFRYYRSSTYTGQQPIALYKRAASTATETVTINKYGYATYCSALPIDYSSTDGYTAWRISSIADDGTITFEKITEQIKGGQGVLLYNKDADGVNTSTATITFADGDTEFSDAQNRFVGTTAPTYVASETAYGLSTNKFVKNNVAGVIPAGKAYIPAAEIPNNVRAFTFVFSDPITGISETQTVSPEEFGAMFNLAGQRISQPQKGVIIVNGKKILVR